MARELAGGAGVEISVEVSGAPRRLPAPLEAHLFQIGREALANAVRHARATRIRLEIRFREAGVELSVEDDGCGFEAAAAPAVAAGHFGLVGMRERAEQIGGRLRIQSHPAGGTRIEVEALLT